MKKLSNKMKIVTIGGGSGQSLLLRYLKDYNCDIRAIVSMVDSGGSTGILRKELGVLPPGDVRKCLLALATRHTKLQEAMAVRFDGGHNFGNFVLSGLELKLGGFDKAVRYVEKALGCKGRVIPSTLSDVQLVARLENGKLVKGEANIDVPNGRRAKIKRVLLDRKAKINPEARQAIRQADFIVYTIGDLYSSLIPNLLVTGVQEEIAKAKAVKIFTINRTNKKGETDGYAASKYIETLLNYLKSGSLDYVLADKCKFKTSQGYEMVKVDKKKVEDMGVLIEEAVICNKNNPNHVDGKLLAKALYNLCRKLS